MGLTAAQLEIRRTGITSTDVAKIVGVHPWGSRHTVYLDKLGLSQPTAETLPQRIGNTVERLIVELYESETGNVARSAGTQCHPTEDWMLGTPDRLLTGDVGLLEIKWVGWRLAHRFAERADDSRACAMCGKLAGSHWGHDTDAVPDYVRVQCEWLMMVTGTTACHVAALLGGEDFRIYHIERSDVLGERLVEVCGEFWRGNVLAREAPSLDGSAHAAAMSAMLHTEERQPLKAAPPEARRWVHRLERAKRVEQAIERDRRLAESHLRAIIGDSAGIVGDFGKVTCKRRKGANIRTLRLWPRRKENG
jgi:putative phage-type endonuclease